MSTPVRNTLDHQILVALERHERIAVCGWVGVQTVRGTLPRDPGFTQFTRAVRRLVRQGAIELLLDNKQPADNRQAIRRT